MIDAWLDLPIAGLFAVLTLVYALAAAIVHMLVFHSPLRAKIQTLGGVAAPFFGAIGLLFGLLTGFLANDIADRNRQAARSVLAESDAVQAVQTLSIASVSDMANIRAALHIYVLSMVGDEWPHMVDDGRSAKTEAAFVNLLREVSDPTIAKESGQAVHSALLTAVARIGSARSDRLALSVNRTTAIKWLTVLILGVLTQIAIGLVHLERPRAQLAALTLFSLAVVVALGLIAAQELPFSGPVQLSPAQFQEFLRTTSG